MPKRPKKPVKIRRASSWTESTYYPWLVAAGYAATLVALFREFVFGDGMLFGSDTFSANIYMKTVLVEALRSGSFPQWTPYLFGGMPFVDAFHSDIFYPPSLPFYLLFPVYRGLGWVVIVHLLLGGMAMYAAARAWDASRPASAIAGFNYMLAPYFFTMQFAGHIGRLFVVAWFPIGFLLLKRVWDHGRLRDMALFALVVGLIILTPHVQMAYFSLWAYAGYSLYRIFRGWQLNRSLTLRAATGSLVAVLIALGISAVQLYPSVHYVKTLSPRSGDGLSYEVASSWSLHPEEIVNCLVPEFSGMTSPEEKTYWGRNGFKDRLEYAGMLALLLAVWGLWRSDRRDRWFFAGLAIFGLLYGLGAHTPVYWLFYHVVPNVNVTRAPAMIAFFYLFGISILSAAGIDALRRKPAGQGSGALQPRFLWAAAGVLLVVAVAFTADAKSVMALYTNVIYPGISANDRAQLSMYTDRITVGAWISALLALGLAVTARFRLRGAVAWTLPALVVLMAADHLRIDTKLMKVIDYEDYLGHDPVVDGLKRQSGPFRVLSASDYQWDESLPRWATSPAFHLNYFGTMGLPELSGYHGNQLWSYSRLLGGFNHDRVRNESLPRLLDLTSTRYVLYLRKPNHDGDPPDSSLKLVYHERGVKAYENSDMIPYARLVTCWELEDPADSLFDRLYEPGFDLQRRVLLREPAAFESTCDTLAVGAARVVSYQRERLEIEVDALRPALLVLADNNYPAWQVTVDETPRPILTANGTFRAVEVPAGRHRVTFVYRSTRQRVGAVITLLSLLAATVALFVSRRR